MFVNAHTRILNCDCKPKNQHHAHPIPPSEPAHSYASEYIAISHVVSSMLCGRCAGTAKISGGEWLIVQPCTVFTHAFFHWLEFGGFRFEWFIGCNLVGPRHHGACRLAHVGRAESSSVAVALQNLSTSSRFFPLLSTSFPLFSFHPHLFLFTSFHRSRSVGRYGFLFVSLASLFIFSISFNRCVGLGRYVSTSFNRRAGLGRWILFLSLLSNHPAVDHRIGVNARYVYSPVYSSLIVG